MVLWLHRAAGRLLCIRLTLGTTILSRINQGGCTVFSVSVHSTRARGAVCRPDYGESVASRYRGVLLDVRLKLEA